MLKTAKLYEEQLQLKLNETITDPRYRWYHMQAPNTKLVIEDSFWSKIQFVSVNDEGDVCSYMNASWERPENTISSLSCINFDMKKPGLFANDFRKFLRYLTVEIDVPKITFFVIVGNPAERHYDEIIAKVGGRIVGTFRYDVLIGNRYYDRKYYEWINEFYRCPYCGNKVYKIATLVCEKCSLGQVYLSTPFG